MGQQEVEEVGVGRREDGWREGGCVGSMQLGGEGEEGRVEWQGGGGRDHDHTCHLSSVVGGFDK